MQPASLAAFISASQSQRGISRRISLQAPDTSIVLSIALLCQNLHLTLNLQNWAQNRKILQSRLHYKLYHFRMIPVYFHFLLSRLLTIAMFILSVPLLSVTQSVSKCITLLDSSSICWKKCQSFSLIFYVHHHRRSFSSDLMSSDRLGRYIRYYPI